MPTEAIRRLLRRIGRRGAYLLFLALLDFLVAYSLTQPLPLGISRHVAYQPFIDLAPFPTWVWAWTLTGTLAAVGAGWRRIQPVAFSVAALLKMAWASGYLIGWRQGYVLYVRGWYTAVIWVAFALVTLLIAGWQENRQ